MKKQLSFRLIVTIMLALGLILALAGCNSTESETGNNEKNSEEAVKLKVATNNTQTSWFQFSTVLGEILKKGTENPISLEVLPLAGGIGNVELLAQGEADFAVLHNVASKWAFDGNVAFDKKYEDLRGLVAGLNEYYIGVVARTEFLEKNNITSIADIKEREIPVRIITNPVGSLAEFSTQLTLDVYGLDYKMIEEFGGSVELTSNDVIKSSLQNGQSDIHILVMSKAHPVITEIALTTDITIMNMEDDALERLGEFGFEKGVYPKGQYKGQDNDVNTAEFVASYITTADMDDDTAYAITKAVNENKEALVNGHSSVNDFDLSKAANEDLMGVPIHPGAKLYYEEVGILK